MSQLPNNVDKVILVDGDSIAYMAGAAETLDECKQIIRDIICRIRHNTWEEFFTIFVETPKAPKINFRNHIAVTKPYKGNRKDKERPALLAEAKQFLFDQYGAEFINIYESEDVIAMEATRLGKDKVIIAAIDKDLLQIPGTFFNYRTGKRFEVTEDEAAYNFYYQVLVGDAVDNITGIPNVGPVKAKAILASAESVDRYPEVVAKEYKSRGLNYQYLVEQCRLLYMLRSPEDIFEYPLTKEEFDKLIVDTKI